MVSYFFTYVKITSSLSPEFEKFGEFLIGGLLANDEFHGNGFCESHGNESAWIKTRQGRCVAMNKKENENILKDYHWMMNSIKVLRESMEDAGEGLTAKYGVEASVPKPQGTTSDPVYREILRRESRLKVIDKHKTRISLIQGRLHLIEDERELEVLHWLLEGKSYRWIGAHMGLSFSHIKRIRDSIVEQLTKETNVIIETNLLKHKSAC